MKLQDALDDFLLQLDADGRSIHTRRQYQRHVRAFAAWVATVGHDGEIESVDERLVARFFAADVAKCRADGGPRKATSANGLRTSVRVFFGHAHDAGWIVRNPARLLRRAICSPPPPRAIPAEDLERLLATIASGTDTESRRDHALFGTLATTGVRVGSALALDVSDIDLDCGEIRLRTMKGGNRATVFVPSTWIPVLQQHLDGLGAGPVFRSRDGDRVSQRHVQRRLTEWCRRAGLSRTWWPHSLRHRFALKVYEATGDIGVVQAALAHRSISSTCVYARPTVSQIRRAILGADSTA